MSRAFTLIVIKNRIMWDKWVRTGYGRDKSNLKFDIKTIVYDKLNL